MLNSLTKNIRTLTELDGASGDEGRVREAILEMVKGHVSGWHVDALGNLIVEKKGQVPAKNTVMLAAHMDEVGFMITHIEDHGMARFVTVGGIDPRALLGKRVRAGENQIPGVIGYKAIHLSKDKRDEIPEITDLMIDIGAEDKEDAEKVIVPGDFAVFDSDYVEFGDGLIKAKGLDDRAGCAVLVEILKQEWEYGLCCAFNVQEEVGCRGARTSAFAVAPDYALVVESTTAADFPGIDESQQVCNLGRGPAISFMDRGTIYPKDMVALAFDTAKERGIAAQPKRAVAGGTDASAIHPSRAGVKTLTISMPCRYIHSQASVLKKADIEAACKLVGALAQKLAAL